MSAEGRQSARGAPAGSAMGGHVPSLDGVRGLAILALLAHQFLLDEPIHSHVLRITASILETGWAGVQLFFVLSGYLITGILLDTKGARNYWSSFFMRRVLRIVPLYYLLLVVVFLVLPRLLPRTEWLDPRGVDQAWYWLYASSWMALFDARGVPALAHTWSLSVEEQFYLAWPLVVFALRPRVLAIACGLLAVGALALRTGLVLGGADGNLVYGWTLTRMDAVAFGALAAIVVREPAWVAWARPRLDRMLVVALAALAVTALGSGLLARLNPLTLTLGDTVIASVSALLVLVAVHQSGPVPGLLAALLSGSLLRRFGKHSYAIYVLHLPLHLAATRLYILPRVAGRGDAVLVRWQLAYYAVGTVVLLGLSMVLYELVEHPFLSLKRFFPEVRA